MKIKSKVKQTGECRKLLKIEVPREHVGIIFDEVYRDIQKEASLPGFRKGKVPVDILQKKYKDFAREKAIERLISDSYRQVMNENEIMPVSMPKIDKINFKEDGPLSFEADVEHRPDINLKHYKGNSIKIKKKAIKVSREQLEQSLQGLREAGASYRTIEDRPLKEGDYIICDLDWKLDGKSIDNRSGILLPVDKTLSPEVLAGLIGVTPPAQKSISVNIDKNFDKKEYVGKTAILDIDVKHLQEQELPQLDDEFAKGLGPFKGLEDLKDRLRQKMDFENQQRIKIDMENQVIEQLLKTNYFDLPKSMIESEEKVLTENLKAKMQQMGFTKQKIQEELPKREKGVRDHAKRQVRLFFILEEIARRENISVTQQEYDNFIAALAQQQNQKPADLKNDLEKRNMTDRVYWQIQQAKVIQFLIDNARVEEEKAGK